MEEENGRSGEKNRHNGKENERNRERATINRSKEEGEERVARITNLITERTGGTETGKKQQEEEEEREETKKEVKKLKGLMEDRERRERKNNLVIKGLRGKGEKNLIESAQKFLEEEFEVKGGVKEVQIAGGEGRELIIIQMDSWERREEIMRRTKKLGSRKIYIYIYIDNDLTQEEREVQTKLGVVARKERTKRRKTRVGYKRIEIEGQLYIWNEEENRIVKKRNF